MNEWFQGHFPWIDAMTPFMTCLWLQKMFLEHVKSQVVGGELQCTPDTAVLLASFALQEEFGNHNAVVNPKGFLLSHKVLPDRCAYHSALLKRRHICSSSSLLDSLIADCLLPVSTTPTNTRHKTGKKRLCDFTRITEAWPSWCGLLMLLTRKYACRSIRSKHAHKTQELSLTLCTMWCRTGTKRRWNTCE